MSYVTFKATEQGVQYFWGPFHDLDVAIAMCRQGARQPGLEIVTMRLRQDRGKIEK